jgi:large repetitive protein
VVNDSHAYRPHLTPQRPVELLLDTETDDGGGTVDNVGDIDGDGFDDIIFGTRANNEHTGKAYVILEAVVGVQAIDDAATYTFTRPDTWTRSAWSVRSAGDFNGDNTPDLLIGAPCVTCVASNTGAAYLLLNER